MPQASNYTLIETLEELLAEIPPDSIVSRTFHKDDQVRAILFGFDAGQELSEHTANLAATIQIVQGEARVTLGDDVHMLKAGAWVHMPPKLTHSVYATTPLIMLLTMLEE